jgi:hypothetical protein
MALPNEFEFLFCQEPPSFASDRDRRWRLRTRPFHASYFEENGNTTHPAQTESVYVKSCDRAEGHSRESTDPIKVDSFTPSQKSCALGQQNMNNRLYGLQRNRAKLAKVSWPDIH